MLEDSPYSGLPYLGCRKSRGHEVAECYPIIKWPPNPLPHPSQTATHPAPQIATQGGGHFKLPPCIIIEVWKIIPALCFYNI